MGKNFQFDLEYAKEQIDKINIELYNNLKKKGNSNIIATAEFYSIKVSESLLEDAKTIFLLQEHHCKNRYIDSIIRNMAEQVIEYKYIIMQNNKNSFIDQYFGKNIRITEDNNEESIANILQQIKRVGSERYKNKKRESVSSMAKRIHEKISTETKDGIKISLYNIFSYEAEMEHNSYFISVIHEDIPNLEEESGFPNGNLINIFLDTIFNAFFDTYKNINK